MPFREQVGQLISATFHNPFDRSVWHPGKQRYVDPGEQVLYTEAIQSLSPPVMESHPPINPAFKLVLLITALGTLLFIGLAFGAHMWAGTAQLTGSLERMVGTLMDMAQIGCGAIAGLLGGYALNTR
jgi:hypothetical protein